MRPYFSFGYDTFKLGISLIIGQKKETSLIGYGYDIAPDLVYIKIHLLFLEITFGHLILNYEEK